MSNPIVLPLVGDNAAFDDSMERSAGVALSAADTIAKSYKAAGAQAQIAAKAMSASVDEQVAAAAKGSVAWTESYGKMSVAARNAGNAAQQAARRAGAGVDVQSAAYTRGVKAAQDYESATARAGAAADAMAAKQVAAAKATAEGAAAFEKSIAKFGKYVAGGAVITAVFSVKGAAELQSQMEKLRTQAGATQQQVDSLTKGVLNMAGSVGTGPNELAQGMYHVVSSLNATLPAATRAATELNVLKIAAEGAKVGGANLVDVTNALDAAVVSGISGVQNYQQAMGALNATVGAGDMTMQDLADAYGKGIAVMAKEAGVSITQLGGALAVLGDNNIRGAAAGTLLTSTLRVMKAPSDAAAKALGSIGISSLGLAGALRSGGFVGALTDLEDHLKKSGATADQTGLILTRAFGGRQSNGLQILLGQLDRLQAKTSQVAQGAAGFSQAWIATTKTLSFQFDQLKATTEALADKFGLYLIPKLEAVGKATESVIGWFQKHEDAARVLASVITDVLGAAVAGFAVGKVAVMIKGLQNMGAAMGTLVAQFGLGSKAMVADADETAVGVDAALGATGIGAVIVAFGIAGTEMGTHWSDVMSGMEDAVNAMAQVAEGALNDVIGVVNKLVNLATAGIDQNAIGKVGVSNVFSGPSVAAGSAAAAKAGTQNVGASQHALANQYALLHGEVWANMGPNLTNAWGGHETAISASTVEQDAKQSHESLSAYAKSQGISMTSLNAALAAKRITATSSAKGLSNKALQALGIGGGSTPSSDSSTKAAATSAIPAAVATMLATAKALVGTQYTWGGGHGGWDPVDELKKIGVDCSGFVSQVLHSGGVSLPGPLDTEGLAANLKPGAGKDVTVYDRATGAQTDQHTIISILGKFFEAGGSSAFSPNPGHVVALTQQQAAGELSLGGFQKFHPDYPGALASDKALSKLGVSSSTGQNPTESIDQLVANIRTAIATPANSLIERFGSATTVSGLRSALGSRGTQTSFGGVMSSEAGSVQEKAFQAEILALLQTGQNTLAAKLVTAHTQGMSALVTATIKALDKPAEALLTKFGNGTQTGSISGLERTLGVRTRRGQGSSFGAVMGGEAGSGQERAFEAQVEALVAAGQEKLAAKLVTAHTQAMRALSQEMIAKQEQANSESLTLQATHLQDQTTATQDAASGALTVGKAIEQAFNDMAAGVLQKMQNMQQTTDDTMAAMATATKDQATVSSDLGQSNIDAINDGFQTQIDTLGEKGLYGLNLLAQQEQVEADQVKAYWDQQIDLMQLQLDKDTQAADAAENAAKINQDQVTTQQQMLVAQAQVKLDNVTAIEDAKVAKAQAHFDAVQAHVDTTQIGPAQIAVDMNANASKATQDIFAAQLAKATAAGGVTVGQAQLGLTNATDYASGQIQGAQNTYDTVSAAANLLIQGAQGALNNVTNTWNNILAGDSSNLSGTQTAGTTAEANATGTVGVTNAQANTQYAGSGGTTLIFNGMPLTDASAIASEVGWLLTTKVPA